MNLPEIPLRAGLSGFSEDALVERPAIELFKLLDWAHVDLRDEQFGSNGSAWRESRRDAFLTKTLRKALARLNPGLPNEAIELALDILTRTRSAMSPQAANRELLDLLRDGVDVEFRDADGAMSAESGPPVISSGPHPPTTSVRILPTGVLPGGSKLTPPRRFA